jgi:hypothetical protein
MIFFGINFTFQDIALIAVVSAQATILAYLHNPKWKALLLTIPLPGTFAILSVAQPVDITNVTGLVLLLAYAHGVRLLNWHCKIPVVPAIAISAAAYCALGVMLAGILPATGTAFWLACAFVMAVAFLFDRALPPRDEPGHRSKLPVGLKLLVIVAVITFLIAIKKQLGGFMTVFPMVGLIACYECRHSLWTVCRQIPIMIFAVLAMFMAMRLAQPYLGYAWALVPGWIAFLAVLAVIHPLGELIRIETEEKSLP